jgi:hypothetical protein
MGSCGKERTVIFKNFKVARIVIMMGYLILKMETVGSIEMQVPLDVREFVHHSTTHTAKNPTRCNNVSEFINPYLYDAQHVSGDTPPIIWSLKHVSGDTPPIIWSLKHVSGDTTYHLEPKTFFR